MKSKASVSKYLGLLFPLRIRQEPGSWQSWEKQMSMYMVVLGTANLGLGLVPLALLPVWPGAQTGTCSKSSSRPHRCTTLTKEQARVESTPSPVEKQQDPPRRQPHCAPRASVEGPHGLAHALEVWQPPRLQAHTAGAGPHPAGLAACAPQPTLDTPRGLWLVAHTRTSLPGCHPVLQTFQESQAAAERDAEAS